jgi:hypothetical protein
VSPVPGAKPVVMDELRPSADVPLAYAIVNSRCGTNHPVNAAVTHLRHGLLSEMATRYDVLIKRCRRITARGGDVSFNPDAPESVALASIPMRFLARNGQEITGQMRHSVRGEQAKGVYVLTQSYGEAAPVAMSLTPSGEPVLPRVLEVPLPTAPEKGVFTVGTWFELRAWLSPVEPGPQHVQLELGGRTFHLWAQADGRGGAALFSAQIPASVGRHTGTLTAPGAPPVQIVVSRAPPTGSLINADSELARAREAEQRAQTMSVEIYRDVVRKILLCRRDRANVLLQIAREEEGKRELLDVLGQLRPVDPRANANEVASWLEFRRDTLLALCQAAYLCGDAKLMERVAPDFIATYDQEMTFKLSHGIYASGASPTTQPGFLAGEFETWLHRALVVGVPPENMAPLLARYADLRRRQGARSIEVDLARFDFTGKGGTP